MALDKKLIHFKTWNNFISDNGVKGNYATPSSGTAGSGSALYGQIKETSIVFIQDVQKIWTHGQLYDCSSPDLSKFLTAEDLSTLNNFMNTSSVSKSGETLTVKINNSTQSLTNTWRSISDKVDGTSSTISASEKAVKAAYDLANGKQSPATTLAGYGITNGVAKDSIGNVTITGNLIVNGDVSSGSDVRFKNVIEDKTLNIEDIANAPYFSFMWNDRDDETVHAGTSAQYWENIIGELVEDDNDFKKLNYSSLGVAMGISLAKTVVKQEQKINDLEDQIELLKQELKQIKDGLRN